jgi:hypothetical protein
MIGKHCCDTKRKLSNEKEVKKLNLEQSIHQFIDENAIILCILMTCYQTAYSKPSELFGFLWQ